MPNDDKKIKYGTGYDTYKNRIQDTAPEQLRKVYVYKIAVDRSDKGFFIPGGTSFVRLSRNINEFRLIDDEDNVGEKYFEGQLSTELNSFLANEVSASYIAQELEVTKNYYIKTFDFFDKVQEERFLITVDTPYDINLWNTGDQEVFIVSQKILADSAFFTESDNNIDDETVTAINVVPLRTIQDGYAFTKIIPYVSEVEATNNLTELLLKVNEGFLLERVTGYTETDEGRFLPLDLKSKDTILTPMKSYPTSLDNHLTSYFDWLDLDVTMPETLAKQFLVRGGVKLNSVLTQVEDFQLVSDMILFTAGFQQQFKQVARNDDGKFEPNKKIGYSQTPLSALVGQNPVEIISALVDDYLKSHPSKKDSNGFKTVTSLIAALSRYIISTYSIANGNNTFNEFYLPWYLDLTTGLGISESNNILNIDPNSLKFELKSKWFELEYAGKKIKDKQDINLTTPRIRQLQNKFQMPELPVQLTSGDLGKAFNPGAIDPNNPKELNYILYNIGGVGENDESVVSKILDTEAKTIPAGTQFKVSTGDISTISLPAGLMPRAVIESAPSSLEDLKNLLYVGPYSLYIGTDDAIDARPTNGRASWIAGNLQRHPAGTFVSNNLLINNYFKERVAQQLGITDLSAIDVSIPNSSSASGWTAVSTSERSIDNSDEARGRLYANLMNIALGDLYKGSPYLLQQSKAPIAATLRWAPANFIFSFSKNTGITMPNETFYNSIIYFGGYDGTWNNIGEVKGSAEGQWYSKWAVEPVSLQGNQGVVRYKQIQPKEIIVHTTKPITINSFTEGKVLFNKSNWNRKIKSTTNTLDASLKLEVDTEVSDYNESLAQMKILEIKGLMLESVRIDNLPLTQLASLELDAPSNSDESITVMRIAFL